MQNTIAMNLLSPMRHISFRFNLKAFLAVSFILIIFLLFFYVFQINNLFSSSYSLHNTEKNIKVLAQENERLQAQLAEMGSLGNMESLILGQRFEKINQIHYIQIQDISVAVAK